MKLKITILFYIILMVLNLSGMPHFRDDKDPEILINELASAMTDEELLGHIYFLGYVGTVPSADIKNWITRQHLGGVKIFTRNVKDLTSLARGIDEMQRLAAADRFGIPLFIATDQEGGWVRHIKEETLITPGALALGATGVPHDAYLMGYYMGMELNYAGINMNFAPTVDIYSAPGNMAIGPRSFSSDPVETGLFALAYFKGMEKAGILCTAKHFPGHGGADLDSHGYLPEVPVTLEVMRKRELVPYRFLIKEELPAIMTGHLAFPLILEDKTPATLSPFFLTNILRGELRHKGILMTDDLEMYGVREGAETFAEVTHLAVMAGNDMLLISHTPGKQEQSWRYLTGLMKNDPLFKARVVESVKRILRLKIRYFKGAGPVVLYPDYKNTVKNILALQEKESKEFLFQTACRSITLLGGEHIPYKPEKEEHLLLAGQYSLFLEVGAEYYPRADLFSFPYAPTTYSMKKERERFLAAAKQYDTIIYCLANTNSKEVLDTIKGLGKKVIVFSVLSPVYLDDLPWVNTAIAAYGVGEESFRAGFSAIAGEFKPTGRLPLHFDH